ncbi:MAG: sigma-70 family RNA polymerase sigma factor [Kiritimatiellae bacterium]|nr:sigma-70 family RNA polymerase sigma factor [Kiritimatiellia bacterium]
MSTPNQAAAEQAIERVKAGEIDAYATVVELYERPLRAMIAGLCPPGLSPDEIAQTVFVEAYRRIDEYKPGTHLQAWLKAIARFTLLGEYKKRKREAAHQQDYLRHALVSGLGQILHQEREPRDERMAALHDCVGSLDDRARDVLMARYQTETPLKTIANRLGRTVEAIKFQLFATRRKLRECVERKLAECT